MGVGQFSFYLLYYLTHDILSSHFFPEHSHSMYDSCQFYLVLFQPVIYMDDNLQHRLYIQASLAYGSFLTPRILTNMALAPWRYPRRGVYHELRRRSLNLSSSNCSLKSYYSII